MKKRKSNISCSADNLAIIKQRLADAGIEKSPQSPEVLADALDKGAVVIIQSFPDEGRKRIGVHFPKKD